MEILSLIAAIIVIIGAANWGLVGALDFDLVKFVTPGYPMVETGIKIAVGLTAIYFAYVLFNWSKKDEKEASA